MRTRTPRTLRLLAMSSLLAVAGLTTFTPAPSLAVGSSTGAPPPPGGVALTWAPTYMSNEHAYTRAEAEDLAREFDLVTAMPVAFKDHADAMRTANPDLTLLAYANATLAQSYDAVAAGLPEAAYAHDASGQRISYSEFGTYLMETSNLEWRATAHAQCDDRAARGHYDGCLLDMLTLGVYAKNLMTGIPVLPGTATPYTQAEYRTELTSLAASYREASPSLLHLGNAIENSYRYWQSPVTSQPIATSMPGAQMEDFLRGARDAVTDYPTAADWVRNVDVVRDLEARGVTGLFTTKLWSSASDEQTASWQRYAMATFLMGADGDSYFAFTRSRDKAGATGANLPYRMPKRIGLPTGAMAHGATGAWKRSFSNGLSVVNPTTSTVEVDLGGTFTALDGRSVTRLTLGPNGADVLLGTPAPVPAPAPAPDPAPAPAPDPALLPEEPVHPVETVDVVPPTGSYVSRTATNGLLSVTGTASDDVAVKTVSVAIRNEATKLWLRADGSWGAFQLLAANVATPGAGTSTWATSLRLPAGKYGLSLTVADAAGNENLAPRPWTVVTVEAPVTATAPAPIPQAAPVGTFTTTVTTTGRLRVTGTASDDRSVKKVGVAVRNEATRRWLQADGRWGAYRLLPAQLVSPGAASTDWSISLALPAGKYGLSLTVEDAAGNRNVDPKPWTVVTVPSS